MQRKMIVGNICWLDVKIGAVLAVLSLAALWPALRWLFR